MPYILPVFYAILQLIVLMGVGVIVRRLGGWTDEFFTGLSRFVVRVALPLYFVVRVGRTNITNITSVIIMPLAALGVIAVSLALSVAVFALLPYRGTTRRAGIAMASFGNAGYMPLTIGEVVPLAVPSLVALYQTDLVPLLIGSYVFVFSPLLWSVGNHIITARDGGTRGIRLRDLISPPLIGIVIGFALSLSGVNRYFDDPALPIAHLFSAIDRLSAITLPLALVSLGALVGGLKVERGAFGHYAGVAIAVAIVRYLLLPGLFFGLYALGITRPLAPAVLFSLFLEMNTPPATNFSLMVGQAGVNTDHAAVTLLVNYLAYVVAMPLYIVLFISVTSGL